MKITFGGHEFITHHFGGLYWPAEKLLIVSDLHLEKGTSFAKRGFFLPPYDSKDTLRKLHVMCDFFEPKRVMLLGDSFHDEQGHARLHKDDKALFSDLLKYDPIWITGNHDGSFAPDGFEIQDNITISGIQFCHEATNDAAPEISGHYHPKMEILHKGARIVRPCFVEDGRTFIMPAIGSYTGGLFVTDPVIAVLFKSTPRVYLLGQNRVFDINPVIDNNTGVLRHDA